MKSHLERLGLDDGPIQWRRLLAEFSEGEIKALGNKQELSRKRGAVDVSWRGVHLLHVRVSSVESFFAKKSRASRTIDYKGIGGITLNTLRKFLGLMKAREILLQ